MGGSARIDIPVAGSCSAPVDGYPDWGSRGDPHRGTPIAPLISSVGRNS